MVYKLEKEMIPACYLLAEKLWPDLNKEAFLKDLEEDLTSKNAVCFLYKTSDEILGFVQASLRVDYVEGSHSSPVAYIEGIYVKEKFRKAGIALSLIKACEAWGQDKGCTEIASDCEIENCNSINFHKGVGFKEANRVVCFIKPLD